MSGRAIRQAFSLPPPPTMLTICLLPLSSQLWVCERERNKDWQRVCVCVCTRERDKQRELTLQYYYSHSSLTNHVRTTFVRALTRNKDIFVPLWVTTSSVTALDSHKKNINTQQKPCFVLFCLCLGLTQVIPWGQKEVLVDRILIMISLM